MAVEFQSDSMNGRPYVWISGPVASIVMAIIMPAMIFGKTSAIVTKIVGGLIGSAIATVSWTAYLSKSKRVRNTYGSPKQPESRPEQAVQIQTKEEGKGDRDLYAPLPNQHKIVPLQILSNPDNEHISHQEKQPTLTPTISTKMDKCMTEICLCCRKAITYEINEDGPACPECGWTKPVAQNYANEQALTPTTSSKIGRFFLAMVYYILGILLLLPLAVGISFSKSTAMQ